MSASLVVRCKPSCVLRRRILLRRGGGRDLDRDVDQDDNDDPYDADHVNDDDPSDVNRDYGDPPYDADHVNDDDP